MKTVPPPDEAIEDRATTGTARPSEPAPREPSTRGRIVAAVSRAWSRPGLRRSLGALLGLVLGAVVGFYLTLAIFVAQARAGIYVFSLEDLTVVRWQVLPTIVGLVCGALLGWRSVRTLLRALLAVLACALVLAPVGWFVGSALWVGRSAPWAGAVLASALGVLCGPLVATFVARWRGASGRSTG